MGVLAAILSGWNLIRDLVGRTFRDWSVWAAENPLPAAVQLELIGRVLENRADAYRRQDGWRARRDRKVARALFEQAAALRRDRGEKLRTVCGVRPGNWLQSGA